jgi:hypothetical protein
MAFSAVKLAPRRSHPVFSLHPTNKFAVFSDAHGDHRRLQVVTAQLIGDFIAHLFRRFAFNSSDPIYG